MLSSACSLSYLNEEPEHGPPHIGSLVIDRLHVRHIAIEIKWYSVLTNGCLV